MTDEISSLKTELELLKLELLELRAQQDSAAQQPVDSNLFEMTAFRAPPVPDEDKRAPSEFPPRRPFDIWYDPVQEEWKIYLPNECLMIGSAAAVYRYTRDANDNAAIPATQTLFCHVFKPESPGDDYKYSVDNSAEAPNAIFTFRVARFADGSPEVAVQYVTGSIFLESVKKKARVVTDTRLTMDGDNGLVLHITKAPVLVGESSGSESSASLSESSSSSTVATFTEVTYVTGSVYNPAAHQFRNLTRTVKAIVNVDDESSGSASVFTAEPVCR